jgi:hypothetical protein
MTRITDEPFDDLPRRVPLATGSRAQDSESRGTSPWNDDTAVTRMRETFARRSLDDVSSAN